MQDWRSYDQAGLNAQFELSTIRDLEAIFARRLVASRRARAAHLHRSGVPYGPGEADRLDVFPVPGGRDHPVMIFIHGGFWRSLDAATFSFVADGFVPHGAALINLDYPLIPAVRLADIVASCKAAIVWIHRNARSFGASPDRIYVSGNSAGGHLAALLADRSWPSTMGLPTDVVKGACAMSGLYDLEPVQRSSQNETLHLSDDEVSRLSPRRHLPHAAAPTIFTVGGDETAEFRRQNRDLADAWSAAGLECEHRIESGLNHISIVVDGFAAPGHALNTAVRRMMGIA